MLSSMNVTVIPFLLGAVMFVEDVTEWYFGPEYTFQLNKIITVYINKEQKINLVEKIRATVVCRPKILSQNIRNESEILFCHVRNIIVRTNITRQVYEDWNKIAESTEDTDIESTDTEKFIFREELNNMPDQLFQIEFGRQGVQNFEVGARKKELRHYDIIKDIVEQFNPGTDLSTVVTDDVNTFGNKSYVIITLKPYKENTTKASECITYGVILYPLNAPNQHNKDKEFWIQENKFGFKFQLLPKPYSYYVNKPFSINSIRSSCNNHSQHLMFFNLKWRIEMDNIIYFNKLEINNKKPKFSTYNHLEGYVHIPTSSNTYHFTQDVYLHLFHITPAQEELNIAEYD